MARITSRKAHFEFKFVVPVNVLVFTRTDHVFHCCSLTSSVVYLNKITSRSQEMKTFRLVGELSVGCRQLFSQQKQQSRSVYGSVRNQAMQQLLRFFLVRRIVWTRRKSPTRDEFRMKWRTARTIILSAQRGLMDSEQFCEKLPRCVE